MTAAQGQQVEFQCDTSAWLPEPTVSWAVNGVAVDSSQVNTSSAADGDFFNSTSVLKFQAASSGTVECRATIAALRNPISSSVFLTVGKQLKHSADDEAAQSGSPGDLQKTLSSSCSLRPNLNAGTARPLCQPV